jgi:CHAT domain-containing protein
MIKRLALIGGLLTAVIAPTAPSYGLRPAPRLLLAQVNPQRVPIICVECLLPDGPSSSTILRQDDLSPWTILAEETYTQAYSQYLAIAAPEVRTLGQTQALLRKIAAQTTAKPALLYLQFSPSGEVQLSASAGSSQISPQNKPQGTPPQASQRPSDQLDLVLVPLEGKPVRKVVAGVRRDRILAEVKTFREAVNNPLSPDDYHASAQQLHRWLIEPLEPQIKALGVNNLVLIPDEQLRSLPYAALHNGREFLIERYSLGLMPSFSLADPTYRPLRDSQVLAMGASQFKQLDALPAAGLEVELITQSLWRGKALQGSRFTPNQLIETRHHTPYGIVHLATHANFDSGSLNQSFIAFGDEPLGLDKIRTLQLHQPLTELLVLSACQTALGDRSAEMGFAGMATKAGVKSAIASLWSVDDTGTLGLMAQLYHQFKTASTKSEGLRQAQLALLRGQVKVEGGFLIAAGQRYALPPDLAGIEDSDYRHPSYWAGFTTVGSPW